MSAMNHSGVVPSAPLLSVHFSKKRSKPLPAASAQFFRADSEASLNTFTSQITFDYSVSSLLGPCPGDCDVDSSGSQGNDYGFGKYMTVAAFADQRGGTSRSSRRNGGGSRNRRESLDRKLSVDDFLKEENRQSLYDDDESTVALPSDQQQQQQQGESQLHDSISDGLQLAARIRSLYDDDSDSESEALPEVFEKVRSLYDDDDDDDDEDPDEEKSLNVAELFPPELEAPPPSPKTAQDRARRRRLMAMFLGKQYHLAASNLETVVEQKQERPKSGGFDEEGEDAEWCQDQSSDDLQPEQPQDLAPQDEEEEEEEEDDSVVGCDISTPSVQKEVQQQQVDEEATVETADDNSSMSWTISDASSANTSPTLESAEDDDAPRLKASIAGIVGEHPLEEEDDDQDESSASSDPEEQPAAAKSKLVKDGNEQNPLEEDDDDQDESSATCSSGEQEQPAAESELVRDEKEPQVPMTAAETVQGDTQEEAAQSLGSSSNSSNEELPKPTARPSSPSLQEKKPTEEASTASSGVASATSSSSSSSKMDRRLQERAARLARAKERIRKKQQAEEEAEKKATSAKKAARQHDDPRRRLKTTYQWYARCGFPTRANFEKRVQSMVGCGVTRADVALLPWIEEGKRVDPVKGAALLRLT